MMLPWKQIVLLSITGCLAGKIFKHVLYLRLVALVVMVYVMTTSLLINGYFYNAYLLLEDISDLVFLCCSTMPQTKCMSLRLDIKTNISLLVSSVSMQYVVLSISEERDRIRTVVNNL